MGREFFKSITYKDGKVFTRQSSSNMYPKDYSVEEHRAFTQLYNRLGEKGFEKWFLTNCIMTGSAVILNGSSKVLRRLKYLSNLLWKDEEFKKLRNNSDIAFDKSLSAKTDTEKNKANEEYQKAEKDIENYVSSFYDKKNSLYKNTMER